MTFNETGNLYHLLSPSLLKCLNVYYKSRYGTYTIITLFCQFIDQFLRISYLIYILVAYNESVCLQENVYDVFTSVQFVSCCMTVLSTCHFWINKNSIKILFFKEKSNCVFHIFGLCLSVFCSAMLALVTQEIQLINRPYMYMFSTRLCRHVLALCNFTCNGQRVWCEYALADHTYLVKHIHPLPSFISRRLDGHPLC